jgi:hypothetical protein
MPYEPAQSKPDPTMPRQMPAAVGRELERVLGWRAKPAPTDFYMTIRDALQEEEQRAAPRP